MDIYGYGNKDASTILIQPIDERDVATLESEYSEIKKRVVGSFLLAAFTVNDWNKDLSPWKAPAVFGKDDFGDGAQGTLDEIVSYCKDRSKTYIIGGYSLAGLFALWAACQTDLFYGVAAASPSMWFPGFPEYMERNDELQVTAGNTDVDACQENQNDGEQSLSGCRIKSRHVYLSIGDKEEKARNPVLSTVGDRIRRAYDCFGRNNINTVLEINEGNHFRDAELRTAKAFAWVVKHIGG
ncbi:MAG: esterase [Lachnospiraceae bacterium]|nr:esterase [Lachnospiraceae bacterium]